MKQNEAQYDLQLFDHPIDISYQPKRKSLHNY